MDPSLRPAAILTDPGPEYADDRRCFQGIPGIERTPGGRLWALWYSGGSTEGDDNYVMAVTSADDGESWSPPGLVISPAGAVRAYDATLWCDPGGRLWVIWAQSYHWWDGRAGVWAMSADDADAEQPHWSAPRRLGDGIALNKPTVLNSGTWLLPAAIWEQPAGDFPERQYRIDLSHRTGAWVLASTDEGATWNPHGRALVPSRAYDEHMVIERADGVLWMLVRTKGGIGQSISTDGGTTWQPGQPSELSPVGSRFFIRRLDSGRLLLVQHEPPEGTGRSHLIARLSDDDGSTWIGGLLLDQRQGVSYPDGVQADDGRIFVIYDYNRRTDKQILMARFTEADVLAGQCVSPRARMRAVVNQATGANPDV
jgi:hypothetical protein